MSRSTTWKDHAGVSQHRPPNQLSIERISLYNPLLNPMPRRLKTPCSFPRCPELSDGRFCPSHTREDRKKYENTRLSAARRGYRRQWQKIRLMYLKAHRLCEKKMGVGAGIGCGEPAQVVDHILPIAQRHLYVTTKEKGLSPHGLTP